MHEHRNQLPGTVSAVTRGDAMAGVRSATDSGDLTAAGTGEAVADPGLAQCSPVVALIKSAEVTPVTV